jgi:hypothetical protein
MVLASAVSAGLRAAAVIGLLTSAALASDGSGDGSRAGVTEGEGGGGGSHRVPEFDPAAAGAVAALLAGGALTLANRRRR